ncbi:MAG TPA: flippase [Kiloniellaceae bacterium]|nr:flippase [Kiloniellaceae bacterium]
MAATVNAPKILRNFFSLSTGKVLGDLVTFVFFIVLSRAFGEEGLGHYSLATVTGGFCLLASDFGLYQYTVREISKIGHLKSSKYKEILVTRSLTSTVVTMALLLGVFVTPVLAETRWILFLIGVSQVFFAVANGLLAFFVAHERMAQAAIGEFGMRALSALTGLLVVWFGGSLVDVAVAIAAVNLASMIGVGTVALKTYADWARPLSWPAVVSTLRASIPFAIVPLLRQAATRLDILLVSAFLGASAVGIYNAAYRVVFITFPLFYLLSISILPSASNLYERSPAEFSKLVHRSLGVSVLISIPSATGICLIAPKLIGVLFGAQFQESGLVLQLLSWQVLIAPCVAILSTALISCHREKQRVTAEITGLALGFLAYCLLIPWQGLVGAAIASAVAQAAILAVLLWALRDIIGMPKIGSRVAIAVLGSGCFALVHYVLAPLPLYMVIPLSVAIYAGVVSCFSDIRANEINLLVKAFKPAGGVKATCPEGGG